jgi:metaxin
LSPPNEPLLRRWYVDPTSRSQLVRDALLRRVRAVAREEVAKSAEGTSTATAGNGEGWKLSGNVGDLLSWALAGTPAIDPDRIYADARRALAALETLLYPGAEGEADQQQPGGGGWFFGAPNPTLFDTAVFSYVYLILNGARASSDGSGGGVEGKKDGETWGDDTLRRIVLECPRLVAHTRRILDLCWGDLDDGGWVSLHH